MKLAPLFAVITLDLIGFAIVIPILPFFASTYGANGTILGLILASFPAMQFFFSPVWGRLSDRIGRRPVLMMTVAGGGIAMVMLAVSHSLAMIFVSRLVAGACAANIGVATAYISDATDEKDRASGMGLIGAAFGIGFVIGQGMGGALAPYGFAVPLFVAAGLNALNLIQIWFKLPEPQHHRLSRATRDARRASPWWRHPMVRALVLLNFLFTFAVSQLESLFAFFMRDRLSYDQQHVGYLLAYTGFIMVLVQGGLIRRLKMVSETRLLWIGAFILSITFAALSMADTLRTLLVVLGCSALGRGLCQPAMLSLVSKDVDENDRGAVMGSFQSAASLARIVGPIFGGRLYDWHAPVPFWTSAVVLLLVALSAPTLRRIAQRSAASSAALR